MKKFLNYIIISFVIFCATKLVYCLTEDEDKHDDWIGRNCCHLAQYSRCKTFCHKSESTEDLQGFCRLSDEPELYTCLERKEDGERCCRNIVNESCKTLCQDFFDKPGNSSSTKIHNIKDCFHQIPKCLKNIAENLGAENSKQYVHCCNEAKTLVCLDACRKTLHSSTTIKEILDELENKCEPVFPHSPLWTCILQSEQTKTPNLPLDIGKLSCCSRAQNSNCQDICLRAFQSDWEVAWNQLESICLSSPNGEELRRCLEEADDPCEIGCSGLSYCGKFNDRSTTLFRTCSANADSIAKWESEKWLQGGLISGFGTSIRVHPSCPTEILQAVACFFQIRPCESTIHESRLCRDDCIHLMTNCIDWSITNSSESVNSLCSKLSPSRPDVPCVSFRNFIESSETDIYLKNDITTPCKNNPCGNNEVCIVEPNIDSKFYSCVPSCSLGKMSKLSVPIKTWIQVPRIDQFGCLRICQCTLKGLEKCQTLNCYNQNSCWVQDRFVAHRTNFYLDCQSCHCFEGEITCSKKNCLELKNSGLPCACSSYYKPVCGRTGITYASACLAKCSGLTQDDITLGSCSSKDPCKPNPCNNRERCFKKTRVCLSSIYKPCKQFECIPENCKHKEIYSGPVCDSNNKEHSSICSLIKSRATLSYRGHCLKNCSLQGPVCGINGEVYMSECAAWAEKTVVDYYGNCVAVGFNRDETKQVCGNIVKCPSLKTSRCIGTIPPGACCPVCGGAGRISYSKKQLDRIYYMMEEEADRDTVTLDALLSALGRQLEILQCSLRGSVTIEGDIFILTQPTTMYPSKLQQKACIIEMEKIITRISERSPKIISEVPLSSLRRAENIHGYISSAIHWKSTTPVLLLLLFFLVLYN
ncbi:hypothetical protein HCN44_006160 [Aphidius gifuensis]|uniref:Kazal-like domain-containing protein n=1 Tax=Aphidius gifuensis TaxID=684658 RepID=A0A835CV14_APHGI|nr:reversion-inducing cysteine-rich protein with Kazal motifs [Aphidius gifuensis]KAF7997589.1 hypothetical protein HCN44_006160 [Aphidius gifuensis]